MLNVVNFGGGAYVIYAEVLPTRRDRGRPGALLGHVRPPRAAAADRGQRAGRRDRPDRLAPRRPALARARRSSTRSASTPSRRACTSSRRRVEDDDHAHGRARGARAAGCSSSSTGRQNEDRYSERVVEPYALFNGREALVRRGRGTSTAAGCATSGWTGSRRAAALDERFERREGLDPVADIGGWPRTGTVGGSRAARVLDLRRAGALGARAAHRAGRARRRRDRRRDDLQGLDFLVREVLKEAGDAVVLEPADAREAVLAAAEGLIARAT